MMGRHVVVIGGGVAGLEAAGRLSAEGLEVSLLEKDGNTGGHLNRWFRLFPDRRDSTGVTNYLTQLTGNVRVLTDITVEKLDRHHGRFTVHTREKGELTADAVVIATGFDLFRSSRKEEYGYGIYDNVISSADLEDLFRKGELLTSSGKVPQSIGMVHCVGSRDEKAGNLYCSKLCCVTAVKQAIELKEQLPDTQVYCFYMDMRMGGAHYEELYREAQEKWGVNFIRGKVSEASEDIDKMVVVKVEDTLAGRPLRMKVDLLVLMAGMEMSEGGKEIAGLAGLTTGENRFFSVADQHFGTNRSNVDGIFYAGACTAPMNITDTISHARAAVSEVVDYLRKEKI
jgi:heterodisulfide reductase subunit A2